MFRLLLPFIFLTFFWSAPVVMGQRVIEGLVIDTVSGEPLAFVNILANGNKHLGVSTDIDGKFILRSVTPIHELNLSYVGYEPMALGKEALSVRPLVIRLKSVNTELQEFVVLPGENPAHRIINNAVDHRKMNNPERIPAFSYLSYNKFTLKGSNLEKIQANRIKYYPKDEKDSIAEDVKEVYDAQHFFLMESVTKRDFAFPDQNKEVVLSSRVSGLAQPSFAPMATDMQPFSFYKPFISLAQKDFVNPISHGSTKKYLFLLEDTLYHGVDSVFVISYRPKKGAQFEALQGVISISSRGWAIENVIAEPAFGKKLTNLKVQQLYTYQDSTHWFPTQLNFDFEFKEQGLKWEGRSYLDSIHLQPEKQKFNHLVLEVHEEAANRSGSFWDQYRQDSLTSKELATYEIIDSLGKKFHFDKWMGISEALITDKVAIGPFFLEPSSLLQFNEFEGVRTGLGIYTGDKISKRFSTGGYFAYGFQDKQTKYGGRLDLYPTRDKEIRLRATYKKDVEEPGVSRFLTSNYLNSSDGLRDILSNRMNNIEQYMAEANFRSFRFLITGLFVEKKKVSINADYHYTLQEENLDLLINTFNVSRAGVKFRYAYREKMVESYNTKLSLGTKFPILWVNAIHAFEGQLGGQFEYDQVEAKISYDFRLRSIGKINLQLESGFLQGAAPYTDLFLGKGSFSDNMQLVIDNSFQTMRLYEFLSDQYVQMFYSHHFGNLRFKTSKFKPGLILTQNVGFGTLSSSENHRGIDFQTMEKGFYETGLILENLFRITYVKMMYIGFGGGAFYRTGPYSFEDPLDNLAFKFDLTAEF